MTRKDAQVQARTSSIASSRSTDTIHASTANANANANSSSLFRTPSRSRTPIQLKTERKERLEQESQISPTSGFPRVATTTSNSKPASLSSNVSPKEHHRLSSDFGNYRRDLSVLETSGARIPQIQHNPPTAAAASPSYVTPWMSPNGSNMPSNAAGTSFYDDSSDNHSVGSQLSPGFRPGTARTGNTIGSEPDVNGHDDERRPSLASITTVSSSGSKGSIVRSGIHKKLQGFFGEEFPGRDGSDTSLPTQGLVGKEHRSNSYSRHRDRKTSSATETGAREASPAPSRPRTPVPSSDVVPFLYQDSQDISIYGEAPVRENLSGLDRERYISDEPPPAPPKTASSARSAASAKVHQAVHGHRHNKSDDSRSGRPGTGREDLVGNTQKLRERGINAMPPSSKLAGSKRAASPTPSNWSQSTVNNPGQSSGNNVPGQAAQAGKKSGSILSRFRVGRHKEKEESGVGLLKQLPGSVRSLAQAGPESKGEGSPDSRGWARDDHFAQSEVNLPLPRENGITSRPSTSRQGTFAKLPFSRKGRGSRSHEDQEYIGDPNERKQSDAGPSLFDLDSDLSNMEGILSQPQPLTPLDNNIFAGTVDDEAKMEPGAGTLGWNAPDSWAVKKVDDANMARLSEIDETGIPPKADASLNPYCIRIFKGDGTFATLPINLNATVTDVITQLGKKTHMTDTVENYQIILKKHDLQRILGPGERPAVIQKRLLEQAGYEEKDNIEDIGREDQSYLCRFLFIPQRDSGYTAISQDPTFPRVQKFSHVDLCGRNLITIPIALYSKATEIISLNLSRNLSLDLPKDFIQSCINLRDIKYISNEAWKLPQSISRASRLTILDVSNNRLEQLEHAELDRLNGLISLKLANNRLSHLPPYFGAFKQLRTLNVSSNFLESFPDFLCDLPGLVDIDLSFNAIGQLPDDINKLRSLERLVITNNRLTGSLPRTFSDLSTLKEVDIRYNALSSIDVIAALPRIELISADHNAISVFEGTFEKIKILRLNSNPVTKFEIYNLVPTLTTLILSNAKLAHIPDASFDKMPNLIKLNLDKNHFVSLPSHIGKLRSLEYFSIARNSLSSLPPEIGCLNELRFFDCSQNNLKQLPMEIWWANKLETLNISANVLENFPKPGSRAPQVPGDVPGPFGDRNGLFSKSPSLSKQTSFEEFGPLDGYGTRRPSQASGSLLAVGTSPVPGPDRKNSIVSIYGKGGRQASVVSRTASASTQGTMTPPPSARKDSSMSAKLMNTFAASLKNLFLAENNLDDDVFDELTLLSELRILNLSYNDLNDLPQRSLKSWPQLVELYLSGNELTSLPSDDFEDFSLLQTLFINGNKFQTLPAELGKAHRLTVLDVGSNSLKYNVSNWPYDWNWNCNPNLKYLNLSGNKRLEIKPNITYGGANIPRDRKASTDFISLTHLRILGLMDVTLTIPTIPDETEDRRVRTSGTLVGSLAYGMADTLGRGEHLSIIDMVVPRFNSNESETLLGMFDGQAMSNSGSKVAKYLHENFGRIFSDELKMLNPAVHDTTVDALRRAFLSLNKELACTATNFDERSLLAYRGSAPAAALSQADLNSGSVATVVFLEGMDLYVANVGDAQAMLIQSEGSHRILTRKHDPAEPNERQRIRDAGGWVSRQGKLNDILEVSRAFGYVQLMPAIQAAPHISQITLKEQDEMILIASREIWEYLSPKLIVDVARSERSDLVRAAQKLRDLAMAFGSTGKIMVMIIGVNDLKKRERLRLNRGPSMSMGPTGVLDDVYLPNTGKRGKRAKEAVEDSMLRRLQAEVEAPVGEISIVFTDIKGSTQLWENHQSAMRSAIRMHNEVMRRQLRIIGGYEVKTEGDAFIVSFPTATSALLWCFSVQAQLLEVQWPSEILNHSAGHEIYDSDNNLIFRGLSVRMGIHFGSPVCENDPVTRRMDYFGPMVNKTSRISSTADGGQIAVSADFISEIQRCLETFSESDRSGSTGSEDLYDNDVLSASIRRELRSLSSQGFEVKPMGERKLKGLENPELIYLMYPHALAGRIARQPLLGCDLIEAEASKKKERAVATATDVDDGTAKTSLTIDPENIWSLWMLSLRLERLCDSLEDGCLKPVSPAQIDMLQNIRVRRIHMTDDLLVGFMRNLVIRTEGCVANLSLRRHLLTPSGTVSDIRQLQGLTSDLVDMAAKQKKLLEKYKKLFGNLEFDEDEGAISESEGITKKIAKDEKVLG